MPQYHRPIVNESLIKMNLLPVAELELENEVTAKKKKKSKLKVKTKNCLLE